MYRVLGGIIVHVGGLRRSLHGRERAKVPQGRAGGPKAGEEGARGHGTGGTPQQLLWYAVSPASPACCIVDAVLSSLYAASPASRHVAQVAHGQCRAFVVVYRFASFATLLHLWHIVKSLIVPLLVFLGERCSTSSSINDSKDRRKS